MSNTQVFILVNVIGGLFVLGSYISCLAAYPQYRMALWGGIDGNLRNLFSVSMLPAALGYLMFLYFMVFKSGIDVFGSNSLLGSYTPSIFCAVFLTASTIWMPATVIYIHTTQRLWWNIAAMSLWVTAGSLLALLGLLGTTFGESIDWSSRQRYLAIAGLGYLAFHCTAFDAIIWASRFPRVD